VALKEWAVVCAALAGGEQTVCGSTLFGSPSHEHQRACKSHSPKTEARAHPDDAALAWPVKSTA